MRLRSSIAGLLALFFTATAPAALHAQHEAAVDAATQAAQSWLALLDADKFEATWTQSASPLRSNIDATGWAQRIKSAHSTLDSLRSRSLVEARYTTTLPNMPEGDYVIAQYRATYGAQPAAETVSLMKEQGEWRVAGYVIRPVEQ